jgi:hypothetical protein
LLVRGQTHSGDPSEILHPLLDLLVEHLRRELSESSLSVSTTKTASSRSVLEESVFSLLHERLEHGRSLHRLNSFLLGLWPKGPGQSLLRLNRLISCLAVSTECPGESLLCVGIAFKLCRSSSVRGSDAGNPIPYISKS